MGMSLAGPAAGNHHHHPPQRAGRNAAGTILGYSTSAQYAGQVVGPVVGGFVGGHLGMRAVFMATTLLIFAGAAYNWITSRRIPVQSLMRSGPR